jgi:hypothetical protein
MKALTTDERRAVARRIFQTLCEHYPDRYIALVDQPGNACLTATPTQSEIDFGLARLIPIAVETMKLIGSLIEHLQRWIARYKVALDYADTKERRRPPPEIEWNGAMIGELRRRSSDA